MTTPEPSFEHIASMSDGIGTFEHAEYSAARVDEGYCTDDMARLLIATCRQPRPDDVVIALARMALRFLVDAQGIDGKVRSRRAAGGRWQRRRFVDDCWGRAMWALGTATRLAPDDAMRARAGMRFDRGVAQRSPWPRSMAFAALGAAEVLTLDKLHTGARQLLADAADVIGRPARDPAWPWPEARLAYANAVLADALIAAGRLLERPDVLDDGLLMLRWLLARETVGGHLSPTSAGGAGPDDVPPMFDQQPIEAATMADACARAYAVTADTSWLDGIELAAGWFLGANDLGMRMCDVSRGAGYDGLQAAGVNRNEGAESTLALITTLQLSRAPVPTA